MNLQRLRTPKKSDWRSFLGIWYRLFVWMALNAWHGRSLIPTIRVGVALKSDLLKGQPDRAAASSPKGRKFCWMMNDDSWKEKQKKEMRKQKKKKKMVQSALRVTAGTIPLSLSWYLGEFGECFSAWMFLAPPPGSPPLSPSTHSTLPYLIWLRPRQDAPTYISYLPRYEGT